MFVKITIITLFIPFVLGLEVEDIIKANSKMLEGVDLNSLDFENAKITKMGNMKYLSVEALKVPIGQVSH